MIVADLLRCIRLMWFSTGSTDYPFSLGGTCFLLAYRKSLFAVTANHVVDKMDDIDINIPASSKSGTRLPISISFVPRHKKEPDADSADVRIFVIDRSQLTAEMFDGDDPFPLDEWIHQDRRTGLFFACGYPTAHQTMNYEKRLAEEQPAWLVALAIGPERKDMTFPIVFEGEHTKAHDGMSGAPVIWADHDVVGSHQPGDYALIGMMVRQNLFVHTVALVAYLDRYLNDAASTGAPT